MVHSEIKRKTYVDVMDFLLKGIFHCKHITKIVKIIKLFIGYNKMIPGSLIYTTNMILHVNNFIIWCCVIATDQNP